MLPPPNRLKETSSIKQSIDKLLAERHQQVDFIRQWFHKTHLQGEFNSVLYENKDSGDFSDVTQFQSYKFLTKKFDVSEEDIKNYSKVSFEQYLKHKNTTLVEEKDPNEVVEKDYEQYLRLEKTYSLDLPVYDEEEKDGQRPSNKIRQRKDFRSNSKKTSTGRKNSSFLGRKSTQPVLQEVSDPSDDDYEKYTPGYSESDNLETKKIAKRDPQRTASPLRK